MIGLSAAAICGAHPAGQTLPQGFGAGPRRTLLPSDVRMWGAAARSHAFTTESVDGRSRDAEDTLGCGEWAAGGEDETRDYAHWMDLDLMAAARAPARDSVCAPEER